MTLVTPSTSQSVPSVSQSSTGRNEPKSKWSKVGHSAFKKGIKVSDYVSGYANAASAKMGGERFWPKSGDWELEMEKCARILRAFTEEGVETKLVVDEQQQVQSGKERKKQTRIQQAQQKVVRKIPPELIANAHGIAIYTSFRTGIAPFGGSGGSGLVLSRLPDGSWSAPSFITPQNLAIGFLIGADIFDVVLVINSAEAMQGFKSHKFTMGAETAVVAGPLGAGTSIESSLDEKHQLVAPIYSYVKSRGLYAGVELMGQAFLTRFDENERVYHWPGIKGKEILEGKVKVPAEVAELHQALHRAEMGSAQLEMRRDLIAAADEGMTTIETSINHQNFAGAAPAAGAHADPNDIRRLPPMLPNRPSANAENIEY